MRLLRSSAAISFVFFAFIVLTSGCNSTNRNRAFRLVRHVQIDERENILPYAPTSIFGISPSTIAAHTGRKICVYNSYTGKEVRIFSPDSQLDDKLLAISWPQDSAKGMVYLPRTAPYAQREEDDFFNLSRIAGLYYDNNHFYVIYYVTVDVTYTSHSNYKKALSGANDSLTQKTLAITKDLPIENIISVQSRAFLLKTDTLFNVEQMYQLTFDPEPKSKWGSYFFIPERSFLIKGKTMYAPAHNQESLFVLPDTMHLCERDSLTLVAQVEIGQPMKWQGEVLNTADVKGFYIDARTHSYNNNRFRQINDTLLVQTYCGWYSIPDKKRFPFQPLYGKNETPSGDFDYTTDCMLYGTYDSTIAAKEQAFRFKVMHTDASTPLFDTTMSGEGYFGKLNREYYFINQTGENYYIDIYQLITQ